MRNNRNGLFLWLMCLAGSFIFVMLFSKTTSFLIKFPYNSLDSFVFQTIGKYWAEGDIPYVDLWDHKGPLIYFINAIGYAMAGSRLGIFCIQVLCLSATVFLFFKWLRSAFRPTVALAIILLTMLWLAAVAYEGGNLLEEYLLPLCTASYFAVYKWLQQQEGDEHGTARHSPLFSTLYGVFFACCLLTRVTDFLGIAICMFFILCALIRHREWKNIWHNGIAFLLGFAVVTAPFVLYFYCHNALQEMVYGTLVYNFGYASDAVGFSISRVLLYKMMPLLILLFAGIYCLVFKAGRTYTYCFYLILSLISIAWLAKGHQYGHYFISYVPFVLFAAIEMKFLAGSRLLRKLLYCVAAVFGVLFCIHSIREIIVYNAEGEQYKELLADFVSVVPEAERNSVVAYNLTPDVYINLNIHPCYKFFVNQEWNIAHNKSIAQQILPVYQTCKAKWILYSPMPDGPNHILQILASHYEVAKADATRNITLYHLRE